METEERIRDIRKRKTVAESKKARAEVEREHATKRLREARTALSEEFGISTNADVEATLASLQAELDVALEEAEKALQSAS